MKKKILSILLIGILAVGLTGCGKEKTASEDNSKQSNTNKDSNTLVGKISASNYGDTINYSANGIDDWKIFYNDGENVFIITSNLIPNSKVVDGTGISRNAKYLGRYNVIWDWDNSEFKKYSGVSSIDKNLAKKYELNWIEKYPNDTEHYNMKVVASLFDQNNWASFVDNNYADSAIGSPTIEMFINSWNAKHPDSKVYFGMGDENGYSIGKEENPTDNAVYSVKGLKEDKLYNIVPETFGDDGMGMILASPNQRGDDRVGGADDTSIGISDPFGDYNGVRPIVCLKANVNATYKNGVWELESTKGTTEDTSSNENATSFKLGNNIVKYGTYKGDAAATGSTLILNSDNTAILDGKTYKFTIEKYNFAQDSSSDSYEDAIVLKNEDGSTYTAFYFTNNSLRDDPMVYVYSGN